METTQEISLMDLWQVFKKHFGKIILLTALGAILAVTFMLAFVSGKYESRAQLIVVQQQETNINLSEIQTSVQLINTYRDILTADAVLNEVNTRMGGQYSLPGLRSAISVDQSPNSQAFNVKVTTEDPNEAQNLLTQLIEVFEETVMEVYGEENANITIISPPSFNPNKVAPSLPLYAIIGAFLGGSLSLVWVLVLEVSDTTVKDEDFMQGLGLINLGSISELSKKELKATRLGASRQVAKRRNDR